MDYYLEQYDLGYRQCRATRTNTVQLPPSAPVIVNRWDVEGGKQTYGRLSAGAAASILGGTSLDAAVSATLGRDGGNELGAHIGLRMGF